MSFTDRPAPPMTRRTGLVLSLAVAAGVVAAAAGCGFQPTHAQRSVAAPGNLSLIEIELIEDRVGQMLRNELLERFRPASRGTRFALNVDVSESVQDLGIRTDAIATRANLRLRASYAVIGNADGTVMTGGSLESINSYNILTSDFATLTAKADARRRAVRDIADRLTNRVSVWLLQTGGRPVEPKQPAGAAPK